MKRIFVAAAVVLALAACGRSSKQNLPLEGPVWKLTHTAGIPAEILGTDDDAFTLEFHAADTLVSGRTNCNRFFGRYETQGRALSFGELGMTRMACPDMEYEDRFVEVLRAVNAYEISGSELKLCNDREVLAEFRGTVLVQ